MTVETVPPHWPPHCCVPAFVVASLECLGHPVGAPLAMPHILGVRVGAGDRNPLELPIAADVSERGVSATQATERIRELIADLQLPIEFHHARLDRIPWGEARTLIDDGLAQGAVIGIGVQYDIVDAEAPADARHILRVTSLTNESASLIDDSGERQPPRFEMPFDNLLNASRAASDGLWIFSPAGRFKSAFLPD